MNIVEKLDWRRVATDMVVLHLHENIYLIAAENLSPFHRKLVNTLRLRRHFDEWSRMHGKVCRELLRSKT